MEQVPTRALLRVVPNSELVAQEKKQAEKNLESQKPSEQLQSSLGAYVRTQFDIFKRHRDSVGISDRLLRALRTFNGQYSTEQLHEIKKFGGSEVYARIISMKCRGASSLLRDVYLNTERTWGLSPPPDPEIDPGVIDSIAQLVEAESVSMEGMGQPIDMTMLRDRATQLTEAARQAAKKKAAQQTIVAEDKLDELLIAGNFYKALSEIISDVPLFPYAVLKGPVIRVVPDVAWVDGQPKVEDKARMFWQRVSPFDIWWTPGVTDAEDGEIIERIRLTRGDLNDLLDLPGYNHDAIREILDQYGRAGLQDAWDATDSERADQESREDPVSNESGMITGLEYHGNVQGRLLREYGMTDKDVPDELRDYYVQAWVVGRHVIKVQMSPSPRRRHPYFITSFEKVPGTPVGNGLPDILADIESVCNASLRALVNNLSIASGPQVVVNDDRVAPGADGEEMYPWKRWHVSNDPMTGRGGTAEKPVDFFQPNSNANELLGVYEKFSSIADEISAIPRYLSGSGVGGGAGRTASGLAMLMGNASKVLQTVAANVDRDILEPCLTSLYEMVMLTDESHMISGEESIRVLGVNVAIQRETQRSRQLEFLTATMNPVDVQIIGPRGRATVLREVARTLGIDGGDIVPSDEELEAQQKAAAQAAQAQGQPGFGGMGEQAAEGQGAKPSEPNGDMGPRTSIAGGVG